MRHRITEVGSLAIRLATIALLTNTKSALEQELTPTENVCMCGDLTLYSIGYL